MNLFGLQPFPFDVSGILDTDFRGIINLFFVKANDGGFFPTCPRHLQRQQLRYAVKTGMTFYCSTWNIRDKWEEIRQGNIGPNEEIGGSFGTINRRRSDFEKIRIDYLGFQRSLIKAFCKMVNRFPFAL